MTQEALEQIVINCLKENLELSGEPVPPITHDTKPASDLSGFDSLRTIEIVVTLEEELECDLAPEKIFENKRHDEISVKDIALAIGEQLKAKNDDEQE